MEEKRPLVWLSADHSGSLPQTNALRGWQLLPIALDGRQPQAGIARGDNWVGVFDLSELSSDQLTAAGHWLEALKVKHWVAILKPSQVDNPQVCWLINRYCEGYQTLPLRPDKLHAILSNLWGMSELQARTFRSRPLSYQDLALEGDSLAIQMARGLLDKFGHTEEPVLVYGENGTGKEAAATFIHHTSGRRNRPLVVVNCAALPPSLTQSELFGYEKGSFTHALTARKGKIEGADGGTLLLNGVDEFKSEQQSAILRFLQEGQIERIGGTRQIQVDVRLIATSTCPLDQLVAANRFRSDVFYRLGSLHVLMPPLRERREDLPLLVSRMLAAAPSFTGVRRLAETTTECLARHPWPGNLRELQNRIRQALLLGEKTVIEPGDMGFARDDSGGSQSRNQALSLDAFRSQADRQAISVSLALAHNNISAAARLLNISRVSFYRLMDKYQVLQKTSASSSKSD